MNKETAILVILILSVIVLAAGLFLMTGILDFGREGINAIMGIEDTAEGEWFDE